MLVQDGSMSDRVLIVEDVAAVSPAATTALRRQGFVVSCVGMRMNHMI